MRTAVIATPDDRPRRIFELEACEAAIRPGDAMGHVHDAQARSLDADGFAHARLQA